MQDEGRMADPLPAAFVRPPAFSTVRQLRHGLAVFFGGLLRQEGFEAQSVILYSLRLPRLLQGVLAGIGLSVSGVLLQSVTGNDLASPNIIGVNAGAGFAVILILSYFPAAVMGLPLAAFLGAFLTTLAIMAIANRVDSSKATVILAGIAVQAVLSAGNFLFFLAGYRRAGVLQLLFCGRLVQLQH